MCVCVYSSCGLYLWAEPTWPTWLKKHFIKLNQSQCHFLKENARKLLHLICLFNQMSHNRPVKMCTFAVTPPSGNTPVCPADQLQAAGFRLTLTGSREVCGRPLRQTFPCLSDPVLATYWLHRILAVELFACIGVCSTTTP